MKKLARLFILCTLAGILATTGCSSKGKIKDGEAGAAGTPPLSGESGIGGSGMPGAGGLDAGGRGGYAGGIPSERVIYFDFDRSEIRPTTQGILEQHAGYLSANRVPLRLEGHADERGSREYNLALGERRAEAVKQVLIIMGVPDSLITTLSYGEERPVDRGQNESAWQLNRRVELIYP